jgi:ATP-dependent DNA helicase DinG
MNYLKKEELLALLASDGPLADKLPGFEVREEQRRMICDIIEAFNTNAVALIEAGTGTGKSLAYLLPSVLWALRSGERTVISTNTINLQEQLLNKDIPLLREVLGCEINAVLAKGMGNYLCLRKHEEAMEELQLLDVYEAEQLQRIDEWRSATTDGTRSTLPIVPNAPLWERVMAESDTCGGQSCPHYKDCYFFKARTQAADAHIIIANHHLLFADLAARAESDNYKDPCILPAYQRIVLDEAHHIEDTATQFFADQASLVHCMRLLQRLGAEGREGSAGRVPALKTKFAEHFGKSGKPEIDSIYQRLEIDLPAQRKQVMTDISTVFRLFGQYAMQRIERPDFGSDPAKSGTKLRLRKENFGDSLWQESVVPQVKALIERTNAYTLGLKAVREDIEDLDDESFSAHTQGLRSDLRALANRLETLGMALHQFSLAEPTSKQVRWVERTPLKHLTNVQVVNANLDITQALDDCLFSRFPSVVLCSATLSTNRDFQFVKKRFGLLPESLRGKPLIERLYHSPFNYEKQALLAMPTDLPAPNAADFNQKAAEAIWRLIQCSRGHAFVLFTSYGSLRQVWQELEGRFQGSYLRPMKQGDANRRELLEAFRNTEHAVLFGTDSFWEGVDVAGEALRSVIIVKLPFKVPTEPVIEARTEMISEGGGHPFMDYALPNAIVKFKQGFGRLIRHRRDRGCVVCLDTRLHSKGYGRQFLNSLPPLPQVRGSVDEVAEAMNQFYRRSYHLVAKHK